MLLASIKRLIDRARDALVGKIPDPKGQIDQITSALIYKFMDDLDQKAALIGGKPSFFVGDMKRFAWHKLFVPQISNQQRADLYIEGISKLSKAEHLPSLFRDIFKDAFVPFRAADTISLFLNEINQFPPYQKNSEELGNAFEYLLHFMGTQGDAGQFRTPRHIIDFIVDVVAPNKSDKILDPACGTAGFLVSAYQFITNNFKQLTQRETTTLAKNIKGVDIDPQMAKIARVNLYLHGFSTPEITEDDTLTNEELWGQKYNVILANPPFMTPTGGIKPHEKFGIMANRSEVLFIDYIAEHLRLQGRAGIIVPEGIVFQAAKAYKELRKKLIEDWGLYAVVSLPSGIFNPYSGVKTSILFLDRGFSNSDILFLKVENDGHDLGAQRRKIDKDDLPAALSVIQQWKQKQTISVKCKTLAHNVSKEKIAENGEYNLTSERYREAVDYSNAKWPMVELGKLLIESGKEKALKKIFPVMSITMKYGLIDQSERFKKRIASTDISNYKLVYRNQLVVGFPINEKVLSFQKKYEIAAVSPAYTIWDLNANFKFSIDFLEIILRCDVLSLLFLQKMRGTTGRRKIIGKYDFQRIKIPLPPQEVQEQIAAEINGYQKVIDGAKQVIANWKPQIKVNPNSQMVDLGEVCNLVRGVTYKKGDEVSSKGKSILRANNIDLGGTLNLTEIKQINKKLNKAQKLKTNDIFICLASGSKEHIGKVAFIKDDTNFYFGAFMGCIRMKSNSYNPHYVFYLLNSQKFNQYLTKQITGVNINNLSQRILYGFQIPKPSLKVQKQIVAELESEQHAITANTILIAKMERKIADKIGEIWGNKS